MNIIKYDTFQEDVDYSLPSIFLAGPTVRGHQTHLTSWRREAEDLLYALGFEGNIIVPEFPDKYESDAARYDIPLWEFTGLKNCHCIMFWVPRTPELIGLTTNHEHGYWMARNREKMVYGRPKDAYRMSYLDIMWVEDYKDRFHQNAGAHIYTNLQKTCEKSMELCMDVHNSLIDNDDNF